MTTLVSLAAAACLAIGSGTDHITVRDLAPAFSSAESAPDRPVALAPAPGVIRIFGLSELRRLASSLGLHEEPKTELCFERPTALLDRARILDAMRRQLPDAEIEVLDYSRQPVPEGDLEFPARELRQTPAGGFWSGAVLYAAGHRFTVWAKVKVLADTSRVVAVDDLKAGQSLEISQLRLEVQKGLPLETTFVTTLEQAAGRVLSRSVPAGTALRSPWLIAAKDVSRGEVVEVDVWSGSTHLRLQAVAEASGSKGQSIPVRNPESKKRFWAQVTAKGKVVVGKEGL